MARGTAAGISDRTLTIRKQRGWIMKVSDEVAVVLDDSTVDGNNLFLPDTQLDRKLYVAVNKVLDSLGGKWNRKLKVHVFEESPEESIEQVLLTGEYTDEKKEYQFFETPEQLAKNMVKMAEIKEGEAVLEPSAGKGRIAALLNDPDCVELNDKNRLFLKENGFRVVHGDFLTFDKCYDVIIANPPFTKQQDIDHVTHMIRLAKRKVVAIMSASVMFRTNKKTVAFRKLVGNLDGTIERLPEKTFAGSGTNVNTCIVCVEKTGGYIDE